MFDVSGFRVRWFFSLSFPSDRRRVTQIRQQRAQEQHQRQHVLAFGDPGGGLHHDRVKGKQGRRQPCARYLQPEQQPPEQHRGQNVQQNVLQVIGHGPEIPQLIIQPERRGRERVILLEERGMDPDRP